MGHNLYRMLRESDVFPTATYGEQAVALVIADICMDTTRRPPPNMNASARVCEDLGMPRGTLGNMLAKLAARGLELRVPISKDKHGRPVFAAKGQAVDFLFPVLPPRDSKGPRMRGPLGTKGPRIDGPLESKDPCGDGALNAKGPQDEAQRSTPAWTPTPVTPNSKEDARSLSAHAKVVRKVRQAVPDVTEREIDLFIEQVKAERSPDHIGRYVAGYPDTTIAEKIAVIRTNGSTPAPPPRAAQCGWCSRTGHDAGDCPDRPGPAPAAATPSVPVVETPAARAPGLTPETAALVAETKRKLAGTTRSGRWRGPEEMAREQADESRAAREAADRDRAEATAS